MKNLTWRKIVIIIVITIVTIVSIVYGISTYRQHQLLQRQIGEAKQSVDSIESAFNEEDYEKAAEATAYYKKCYDSNSFSNLPDELHSEKVCSEWESKIGLTLIERISALDAQLKKTDSKSWTIEDFEKLENYITVLKSFYPDGFDYTLQSGEKKHYPVVITELDDYLSTVRYQKSIQTWDSGKKTEAIEIMKEIANSGSSNKTIISKANDSLEKMIKKNPAMGFEVTGGSSNVYLLKNGRYGVICPYCNYDGGMMSTADIYHSLDKHYAGEIENTSFMLKCAGHLAGGCGRFSNYNITIKYK